MRRSFKRAPSRQRAFRPSRVWAGVSGQFGFTGATASTRAVLVQLEAPAALNALTSDPPEDMTVLRVMGDFAVSLTSTGSWTLALMVQDTEWPVGTSFLADADKRMLWSQTYEAMDAVGHTWTSGYLVTDIVGTAGYAGVPREMTRLDIAPKVRIEAGRALYLVAYENGGAAELTVTSSNMRLLFQRSGRR